MEKIGIVKSFFDSERNFSYPDLYYFQMDLCSNWNFSIHQKFKNLKIKAIFIVIFVLYILPDESTGIPNDFIQ